MSESKLDIICRIENESYVLTSIS